MNEKPTYIKRVFKTNPFKQIKDYISTVDIASGRLLADIDIEMTGVKKSVRANGWVEKWPTEWTVIYTFVPVPGGGIGEWGIEQTETGVTVQYGKTGPKYGVARHAELLKLGDAA